MSGTLVHLGGERWKIQVYAGRDAIGRRRHRSRTFDARGEREAKRLGAKLGSDLLEEVDENAKLRGTITELAAEWMTLKERHSSPTTVQGYRGHVNAIVARFGKLPATELTGRLIDAWYAELEKPRMVNGKKVKAMTPNTLAHRHAVLRGMLRQGEKWDMVAKVATRQATPPPTTATEVIPPTTDALNLLLDSLSGELEVIARTIAATGMRRGEVIGLRRHDVTIREDDGKRVAELWIRRAVAEVKGSPRIVKDTKGRRSRRIVIDVDTADMLTAWFPAVDQLARDVGGRALGAEGWMFPDLEHDHRGRAPHAPSWLSSRWDDARGETDIGLHDIRHWHATMLIDAGVPITTVSERLGHAQVSTTMNVYAHAIARRDEQAAAVISGLVGRRRAALPKVGPSHPGATLQR